MHGETVEQIRISHEGKITIEDFFLLLSHATLKSKEFLLAHPEYEIPENHSMEARSLFDRRKKHEPVAYIIGEKEFFALPFSVTTDTLIPRPETELLVEEIIRHAESSAHPSRRDEGESPVIIDVGTGSGAIIVSLAHALRHLSPYEFHATDISPEAIGIAKRNAKRNSVEALIRFHEGSLLDPVFDIISQADSVILAANLPYLSEPFYHSSSEDVRLHEPKNALVSGVDGLDHYRLLLGQIEKIHHSFPKKSFYCVFEISPEQRVPLETLCRKSFPHAVVITLPDLSGRSRILSLSIGKK